MGSAFSSAAAAAFLPASRPAIASAAPAELVEEPRLGQRMGAADEARAQGADAACVESVEAAHRVDLHAAIVGGILAFVK